MPGRKTIEQKKKEGTYRADRDKRTKAIVIEGLPDAPDYIRENVRAWQIYNQLSNYLKKHNALAMVDAHLIAQAAGQGAIYEKTLGQILADPSCAKQVSQTGLESASMTYKMMMDSQDKFFRACKELGVGPKARERIMSFIIKVDDKEDKLSKLVG